MSVVNIKDCASGWEHDPQFVYIGRAGHGHDGYFGNPFKRSGARGSTLPAYRKWLWVQLQNNADFAARVKALHGKTLVCFCKPGPCHGDVLKRAAEYLNKEDTWVYG